MQILYPFLFEDFAQSLSIEFIIIIIVLLLLIFQR